MSTTDHYVGFSSGLEAPAVGLLEVTTSDTEPLTVLTRALMVGTDGDVSVVMADGSSGTLRSLKSGVPYPVRVKQVRSTGTTATGIVGLY